MTTQDIVSLYKENLLRELAEFATLIIKEEKDSSSEVRKLTYRPIVLDRAWMDNLEKATNDTQYNKLKLAIGNLHLQSIADFGDFINGMNAFMLAPIDVTNHAEAISRVDLLRTLYHLLTSPNEQSKGYDFEHFLAHVFSGTVVSATEEGIVDVLFPEANIAAKFIKPNGVIKGSMSDLMTTVKDSGGTIYLIATKGEEEERGKIDFYSFVVDRNNIRGVPTFREGKQMSFTLSKFKKSQELADLFSFEELGTLDLRGCLTLTENIFEALDEKFQNLLQEMQSLVDQVDALLYSSRDDGETQKSAGKAKSQADVVKQKAADIEKTSK